MIAQALTKIYHEKEHWHKNKLSVEDANKYHERLLMNGNIITYVLDGELIGYLEFWRITYEQFGRLVCGDTINAMAEDLLTGEIAYINNMWISEDYRGGEAFNTLAKEFLFKNVDCQYFSTFRPFKNHKPIIVYSRADLYKFIK